MKRILTLILALTMLLSCVSSVSADSIGLFKGMDVLTEFTDRAEKDYVRRDEFAAVAATLMGVNAQGVAATNFADVTADNAYGAAISAVSGSAIMNGVGGGSFAPQATITVRDAAVVVIRLLGYDVWAQAKGGYPTGYISAATSLKFFNKVKAPLETYLTFGDLWALVDWAMDTPTALSNYHITADGSVAEEIMVDMSAPTLLEKNMGLTMYEAVIDSIEPETYSINVTIQDDGKDRDVKYYAGRELTLKASPSLNIVAYDKAPVNIWITDEDELMYVEVQDGYEVVYGSVLSVNKDSSASGYNTAYIDEIVLWDNDTVYEVSEDGAAFFYNEKPYSGNIELVDMYVRMVVKGKEFIAVETWDFKEGGLVTESTFKKIAYKKGDATNAFTNVESYYKQVLILDGEIRDIKELKPDTLVDYYVTPNKDTLILLASQKKHADTFESITDDEVQIGNLLIRRAKDVFTKSGDDGYKTNNFDKLLSTRVSAYVDAHGKIRYITSAEEIVVNNFIGYLIGLDKGKGLSAGNIAYVANLDDDTFPRTVYNVAKDLKAGSLSLTELSKFEDKRNATSVFRFELNGDGELCSVTKLAPYYGYTPDGDGMVRAFYNGQFTQFKQQGETAHYPVKSADNREVFFSVKEKIVYMFEKDGETEFVKTQYSTLEKKYQRSDVYFAIFGPEMSSEIDIIILEGDLSKMEGDGDSKGYGILEGIRTTADAEGKPIDLYVIDGVSYTVDPADTEAKGLKENTIVYFSKLLKGFSDYDIDIQDALEFTDDFEEWAGLKSLKAQAGGTADINLMSGEIAKVDDQRVYLADKTAYFLSGCKFSKWNPSLKKFEKGSQEDFLEGKEVVFLMKSDGRISYLFYMD